LRGHNVHATQAYTWGILPLCNQTKKQLAAALNKLSWIPTRRPNKRCKAGGDIDLLVETVESSAMPALFVASHSAAHAHWWGVEMVLRGPDKGQVHHRLLAGCSRHFFVEGLVADAAAGAAIQLSMGTACTSENCSHVLLEYSGCCAEYWENRKNYRTLRA
jgi:hypothetical protein